MSERSHLPSGAPEHTITRPAWDDFLSKYTYSEKREHSDIELNWYGARFLAPNLARWMSVDPKYLLDVAGVPERPAALNSYAFLRGRLLSAVDLLGLSDDVLGDAAKHYKESGAADSASDVIEGFRKGAEAVELGIDALSLAGVAKLLWKAGAKRLVKWGARRALKASGGSGAGKLAARFLAERGDDVVHLAHPSDAKLLRALSTKGLPWLKPSLKGTAGKRPFTVAIHGSRDGSSFLVKVYDEAGKKVVGESMVSHRVVAKYLNKVMPKGTDTLVLGSCYAGKCATGVAANLARKLGVKVIASPRPVYLRSGRVPWASEWKIFLPKK